VTDDVDKVRIWRTPDDDRLLWMRGITTSYRFDPVGEYVIGVASGRSYHLRRGTSTQIIRPGQLVVLDPAAIHSGSPAERGPWAGRLLVIELPDLRTDMPDAASSAFDAGFPDPTVGEEALARRFVALHRDMERGASTLERQSALLCFLDDLAALSPASSRRTRRATRDDPAIRLALNHLRSDTSANVSLDELSAVSGAGKYHLVRLFKDAFGVPPHAFQVSQRVMLARRLLERGERATDVATMVGFADQSHLHRHFRRRLGITPQQYARAVRPF
jgi:AraC-like DNA-binding protein